VAGEDPAATAARELPEEAGLAATEWAVLLDLAPSPGFTDECVRVFLATGLSSTPAGPGANDEESELLGRLAAAGRGVRAVPRREIVNAGVGGAVLGLRAVRSGLAEPPVDAPWRPPHALRRGAELRRRSGRSRVSRGAERVSLGTRCPMWVIRAPARRRRRGPFAVRIHLMTLRGLVDLADAGRRGLRRVPPGSPECCGFLDHLVVERGIAENTLGPIAVTCADTPTTCTGGHRGPRRG